MEIFVGKLEEIIVLKLKKYFNRKTKCLIKENNLDRVELRWNIVKSDEKLPIIKEILIHT